MDLALFPQVIVFLHLYGYLKTKIVSIFKEIAELRNVNFLLNISLPAMDYYAESFFLSWYFGYYCCDEDLFIPSQKERESCISKKTHFHFHLLFDYLWNEHRWEPLQIPGKRINKNHGVVVSLQNSIDIFLFLPFVWFQYIVTACVCECMCAL